MADNDTLILNGTDVPIGDAPNLLTVIRRAGIDLPTFCYHSELSVYGACRLCVADIEGRGIVTTCSTTPEPGMVVRTHTQELREMRKMTIELLLATHDSDCTTCSKSSACRLKDLAYRLGVREVRFKRLNKPAILDDTGASLVRDPNKCVLCGDCVRMCREVQGIGAIDFIGRGAECTVGPAFGKHLDQVECVNCGQCARVCPTGAIMPKSDIEAVWAAINDPAKTVVVQIAPAVRVALGEAFHMEPGTVTTGQLVGVLRALGVQKVYDTCYAADLTVIEETNEFLARLEKGAQLPQFTSCCPGWVKFAEQYYPDLLDNVSTCRSPQQMFGALAKRLLPEQLGVADAKDVVVVSIMPCTAKKFEAAQDKFRTESVPDVDHVLTTQELARMITEAGLDLNKMRPASLDMPFGFKTGAGIIFGNSGGVSEAVLRYAAEKVQGGKVETVEYHAVRGEDGLREATVALGDITLRLAVVHGLANARRVADRVRQGDAPWDFIEVMACAGGCIGGAGQPVHHDAPEARRRRAESLYTVDKTLQLHKPQDNPYVAECYEHHLGAINGETAHSLLHTHYRNRRRTAADEMRLVGGGEGQVIEVKVCVGTNCHVRGSQELLRRLVNLVETQGLEDRVAVRGTFCLEQCGHGPNVAVNGAILNRATLKDVVDAIEQQLGLLPAG